MESKTIYKTEIACLKQGMNVLVHYTGESNNGSFKTYTIIGSILSVTATGICLQMESFEMDRYSSEFQEKFKEAGFPIAFSEIQSITELIYQKLEK